MITLIDSLLINEFEQNNYKIKITQVRQTGEILSLMVESNLLGSEVMDIYQGQKARDLLKILDSYKLARAMGFMLDLDLKEFSKCGSVLKMSKENN